MIRFHIILIIILLCAFCFTANAETFLYQETTGADSAPAQNIVTAVSDGFFITSLSPYGESEYSVDASYAMKTWKFANRKEGSEFFAERRAESILLHGVFHNKPVDREYTITNAPWHQSIDLALSSFAFSPAEEKLFWTIRLTDLEIFEMVATKAGDEKIKIAGELVDTVRLKVTVTGFLGIFWYSSYWYRTYDQVFVRYEAVHGGPGTPVTIIEFSGKKY